MLLRLGSFSQPSQTRIGDVAAHVQVANLRRAGRVGLQFVDESWVGFHKAIDRAVPQVIDLLRH